MRIRTQALLAILPLFLVMAGVIGLLSYSAARQEMIWGLEEEAKALSVTIAEFVDGDSLRAAGSPRERFERLELPFQRLLGYGQAKQIVALDAFGDPIWAAPAEAGGALHFPTADALSAEPDRPRRLATAEAVASEPLAVGDGAQVMVGYAPILSSDGAAAGTIGVVIDAARLGALTRNLPLNLLRLTLVALAIGTLAALFIAALLTRRVRALSSAAVEVANGAYDREIEVGTIQEVSDLSNTFNTMTSVLKDVVQRAQRTLVEGEQFRTPLDLARTYEEDERAELDWMRAGVQAAVRTVGGGHPGDFAGIMEAGGVVTAFLGRVEADAPLDAAIRAAAAHRALHAPAQPEGRADLFERTAQLLDARIASAEWREEDAFHITLAVHSPDRIPAVQRERVDDGRCLLLHTLGEEREAEVRQWQRVFEGLPPAELVEHVARNLDGPAVGTLMAIGRLPDAAAAVTPAAESNPHTPETVG